MSDAEKRPGSVSTACACAGAMVLLALAACGQKGPLTLPGTAAAAPTQPASSASAGSTAGASR